MKAKGSDTMPRSPYDATAVGVLLLYLWPVVIITYDVWLMAKAHETISSRVLFLCSTQPILGVLIGLLVGFLLAHLFFTQTIRGGLFKPPNDPEPTSAMRPHF
jgi:hypothetical protein